jgi:hypothetical protein
MKKRPPDRETQGEKVKNKAEEFLKAFRENPEIRAYTEGHVLPEGKTYEDGLAELAKHFGYDVPKEEPGEALRAWKERSAKAGGRLRTRSGG